MYATVVIAFLAPVVLAQSDSPPQPAAVAQERPFGAVVAPAALPAGAAAAYGYLGAQEVAGGYRQGTAALEVEGRAAFNYLLLSLSVELLAKHAVISNATIELAPLVGLGLVYDTGSRYFDTANFQHLGLRPRAGLVATFRLTETARLIGEVDVPLALSLSPAGAWHFVPLAGGGAEIYVGQDLSVLVMGQLGLDAIKESLGVPQTRPGYQVRFGLGYRMF